MHLDSIQAQIYTKKNNHPAIMLILKYDYMRETILQSVPFKYGLPSSAKEAVHFGLQSVCKFLECMPDGINPECVKNHRNKRKLLNEWFHEDLRSVRLQVLPKKENDVLP